MILAKFQQRPDERKRYVVDYGQWLDVGETIVSRAFSISPASTPAFEVDASVIGDPPTTVGFFVTGGQDRMTFSVDIEVQTSTGQIKQDTIQFLVRE